jgi:hypothetical protein
MSGTKTSISRLCIGVLVTCGWMSAEPQDYFPLAVGNQWVYRSSSIVPLDPLVIEVTGTQTFDGRPYYRVQGFPGGAVFLRHTDVGTLVAYNQTARREEMWVAFGSPEGTPFDSAMDQCSPRGVVASRSARYRGPLGEFDNGLRITYPPAACADAGLTADTFLPGVGLVERRQTSFAGEIVFELIYARLGRTTAVGEQELTFSLTLDRAVYLIGRQAARVPVTLTARLTLRSTLDQAVRLTYPSGQSFDLAIRNEKGEEVYRWSNGRAFTQALRQEEFGPGERNYVTVVPLAVSGVPLPAGRYTAEGWLTVDGARYAATSGFEVRNLE